MCCATCSARCLPTLGLRSRSWAGVPAMMRTLREVIHRTPLDEREVKLLRAMAIEVVKYGERLGGGRGSICGGGLDARGWLSLGRARARDLAPCRRRAPIHPGPEGPLPADLNPGMGGVGAQHAAPLPKDGTLRPCAPPRPRRRSLYPGPEGPLPADLNPRMGGVGAQHAAPLPKEGTLPRCATPSPELRCSLVELRDNKLERH